jgi:transposase
MRSEFLPPYSPDYNPIELAFSAIKAELRRQGPVLRRPVPADKEFETYAILQRAVFSVTAQDATGWFHKCRYI